VGKVVVVVVVLVVLHRIGSVLAVGISTTRSLVSSRAAGRLSTLHAPGCSLHCKRWEDPATLCGCSKLHAVVKMAMRACGGGAEALSDCGSCCWSVLVLGLPAKESQ